MGLGLDIGLERARFSKEDEGELKELLSLMSLKDAQVLTLVSESARLAEDV